MKRHFLIGVAGTLADLSLSDWNAFAGAAAGGLTAVYMAIQIVRCLRTMSRPK